jgi:predicted AAA+ superfamily ATPase
VQSHPKLGASWEGFVIEQIIRLLDMRDAYFWATHGGAELDLLVRVRGKPYGFEIKYADAPGASRSMYVALHDLGLEHLWVVYPGKHQYALDRQITALPVEALSRLAADLGSQQRHVLDLST